MSLKERNLQLIPLAQSGDADAERELIIINGALVTNVIKRYFTWSYQHSDLVSVGTFGLWKAIQKFDVNKGFAFSSFASRCINNEILMYIRDQKKQPITESLDEIMSDNDSEGIAFGHYVLIDKRDDYGDFIRDETLREVLAAYKETASEADKQILTMRYEKNMSQRAIAKEVGYTQSWVSHLEKKAIEELNNLWRYAYTKG